MLGIPVIYIEGVDASISSYIFASSSAKLISSATPCLGAYWSLKIIAISEDFGGKWKML